jgi:hypothetical protein
LQISGLNHPAVGFGTCKPEGVFATYPKVNNSRTASCSSGPCNSK